MPALVKRVALVTGAGSGIGEAIALLFAAEGASVVATDINGASALNVAERIGEAAIGLAHDVADEEAWASIVGQASARFGRIDILVNNAGIPATTSLWK